MKNAPSRSISMNNGFWPFYREIKKEKILITFLLLFNYLKYGKSSLFCCNGYRHALLKIIFLWISSRYLRNHLQKKKEKKNIDDFFIAVLLHFYDLNYLYSTKSWLSNKKSGMVPKVTLIQNSKMEIVILYLHIKMTWNKLAQRQRGIGLIDFT